MGKGRKKNETNGFNGNEVRKRERSERHWYERQKIHTWKAQGYKRQQLDDGDSKSYDKRTKAFLKAKRKQKHNKIKSQSVKRQPVMNKLRKKATQKDKDKKTKLLLHPKPKTGKTVSEKGIQ